MPYRLERLNNLIQEEVGMLLYKEVEFGLGVLVTVTRAQCSAGVAHSKIYISILPKNRTGKVFEILKKNVYRIQQLLNKQLSIRPVPKIEFELDKGIDNVENIVNLTKPS